ncbi:protein-tyrosine-phosphatase [Limosilactobacillus pontis]|uniref:Protein-tyrosine-phosphatase n=1 Tax=Limosilactobacillus pontis TaxID=35787 RepID=A0A2J6NPE9_9LACO|nr:tyrosine-protein phosphatase [Limosilactobacillus pontis]PMB83185.1 protein-tyrosine-phosphatase [Limosilactobacillus pontis]
MPNRLLNIKDGHNFRDLGGYQTTDGRTVKWRQLLRTGSLANLGNTDLTTLARIPVTQDIDLRGQAEVQQVPDQVPQTATYYHLPVFAEDETDASHSNEEIAKQMQEPGNGYRHMLTVYSRMVTIPSARKAFRQMFNHLLSNPNGATIFHCTAGKDRTGMATFLILSALGVPRETILKDYLLTNEVTADFRKSWLTQMKAQMPATPATDILINNRRALASVNIDYLKTAIGAINDQYGNVQHYLSDYLELSNEELHELRDHYLE